MKQWTLFLILLAVVLPLRAAHALPPCNTYVDTSEESVMGVNTSRVERCNDASIYPAAENNYCLNIHGDHYPTVPICALNTAKTACIPRLPSEVQADRCPISRQLGQCEGACPQPARSEIINQEVIKLNAPRLQIPLITLQPFTGSIRDFKLAHKVKEGDKTFLIIDYLANYFAAMYSFLISIAGIVAGIMIIWAGVKWLTSAGAPDRISDAKKKIADAAVGLVLILSSYTILHIVNPDLVFFKPLRVQYIEGISLESAMHGGGDLRAGETATDPWRLQSCDGFATNGEEFQAYFTHYYKPAPYGNAGTYQPAFVLANTRDNSSGTDRDTTSNSAFFCAVAMECSCPDNNNNNKNDDVDSTKRCYSGNGKWSKTGERHGWAPCLPFDATTPYCNHPTGLTPGETVAADRDCFNVRSGCELLVDGEKTVKIIDSGSGIRGKRFDLFTGGPGDNGGVTQGAHTVKIKNPGFCKSAGPYRGGTP